MKLVLYCFLLILSVQLNAQNAYYSQEVKAKMDQNKIDGLPTLNGIEFKHIVTIASGISDGIYKNDDVKINEAINQVKNELGFLHANFERLESGDLLIHFIDDVDNSVDSIKMALTNKALMASAFEVVAEIAQ